MNKRKSKTLAFLLATAMIVPSANGIVKANELNESKRIATSTVSTISETTGESTVGDTNSQQPISQNVAKIGDTTYTSLMGEEGAIAKAKDGETIELLSDVTEDITLNKNITIDGKKTDGTNCEIKGSMSITSGSIINVKLVQDGNKHLLDLGNEDKSSIYLKYVTFEFSVNENNKEVAIHIKEKNNSEINIENCKFINNAENGDKIENVENWSYGIYIGNQNSDAKFNFKNNHFIGTFRTMLANLNGVCVVEGNTFENKVFSVNLKPTAQNQRTPEATCITISTNDVKPYTSISIKNNTLNNAGAMYFPHAEKVVVENNNIDYSVFQHYIQVGGRSSVDLDIRNNNFNLGNNKIVAVDTNSAIVRFPDNMKVLNYWAWSDTPKEIKPEDYTSYVYSYNEDGSRTFYPESEAALKAFTNPTPGNIAVENNEKIIISENMTIGNETALNIPKDKNIIIEVPAGKTLTLDSADAINITGTLKLVGDGNVVIKEKAELEVGESGKLNIETNLENNGTLNNNGETTINLDKGSISGNKPTGNGKVEYEYTPSKPIHPTYDHTSVIGLDRYETAGKIADKLGSYETAVLVNATSTMSDGLSAAGLAGKEDAAILLVKKDSIPKATMDRLSKVKKVYIIGGENAISQKVVNQLKKNNIKVEVERLGGKTRVETSELVAKEIGNYKKAFVVNGFKGEADAMSASSVAAREESPILLTNGKTSTYAKKSGVEYYVVGGKNVMNNAIAKQYNAETIAGDDRYETNREMLNKFYGASETLYFANGETLVDALTASTISKDDGLVLVGRNSDNKILNRKNTVQVGGMNFDVDFEK